VLHFKDVQKQTYIHAVTDCLIFPCHYKSKPCLFPKYGIEVISHSVSRVSRFPLILEEADMFQKLPFLTSVKQKQYLKGINLQMTSQIVGKKKKNPGIYGSEMSLGLGPDIRQ